MKSCQKVRGFWLTFLKEKQVTAEYWVSLGSKGFCCHKCHFSLVKKCKFRQTFCHKSRILPLLQCTILVYLLNFVKFRQKSIFSPRRPVFVISSVFRQKRSPLEPIHELSWSHRKKDSAENNTDVATADSNNVKV